MYALLLLIWIASGLLVANLARNRIIGFNGAFLISLVTSPIIALIVIYSSPKTVKFTEDISNNHSTSNNVTNEYKQLEADKREGKLSDDDYRVKKEIPLNKLRGK